MAWFQWLGTSSLGFACQLRGANYKQAILQDMDDAAAGLRSMEKEMDACITSNNASQIHDGLCPQALCCALEVAKLKDMNKHALKRISSFDSLVAPLRRKSAGAKSSAKPTK